MKMQSVARSVAVSRAWFLRAAHALDRRALGIWVLAGGLVLYLAVDGGGYDVVVHSQASIVVWWAVLVGGAFGLLPIRRLARSGWLALALFGGFVAWTAIAISWSASSERSLQALSLVAGYLGILVLGLVLAADRRHALRHTVGAVASAVVIVAVLALASRLHPGLIPAASQTSQFLPGTQRRLGWPLNYWNALGALLVLGLPLLLGIGTSARSLRLGAAATGVIPALILCDYLTFSRGSMIAGAAALIAFLALAEDRVPKLFTVLACAGGGAILIAGADHRPALEHGLAGAAARSQGQSMILAIVLVCGGVALVQVAIGLLARHATRPRALEVSASRARALLAGGAAVVLVVALLAGAPHALSRAWSDFKHPSSPALNQDSLSRFGSLSGNQRYDYWRTAIDAMSGHLLGGRGPGTFQLTWLPRAPYPSYVENAHSLYIETLSEEGIIGLALLVSFLLLLLASGVRSVLRARHEQRVIAAAATAAMVAFCVSAAGDWIWQVPVLPAAFILLAAATLAPVTRARSNRIRSRPMLWVHVGAVALAVASLLVIAIPLAETTAVRTSQADAAVGDLRGALTAARQAAKVEPDAASPQLQLALVEELRHDLPAALAAARRASVDEPGNWSTWVIMSRIEVESGHVAASLDDYRTARSLNPRSEIFRR